MEELFERLTARVAATYVRLEHRLGWRLLYSPKRTLVPRPDLALVGLNPGGGRFEPPVASVELGNAYRVERWGHDETLNPLQTQIRLLYNGLADRLGHDQPETLMDKSLAINFCPFRSPSWATLHSPKCSVQFSRALWQQILQHVRPAALICIGTRTTGYLDAVLTGSGATRTALELISVGWGDVTLSLASYRVGAATTAVVGLPHLSRYQIIGRPASEPAVSRVLSDVVRAVCDRAVTSQPNQ